MTSRAVDVRACPAADMLAAFAVGDLTAAEVHTLELHLGECSDCLATVACLGQSGVATPVAELAPGAMVGRYQILARVGAGAFGVVYAAYDRDLDRKVALKLLRRRRVDDEERFLREARAMASVSSRHVVAVHDVGRVDTGLFAAMEFVDGQTLGDWLAAAPRPLREILAAFIQAGRGLAAAHAVGIVHRDFKPDNVLVDVDGRVAVTDFGLARGKTDAATTSSSGELAGVAGPLTIDGALIGTPLYMSPEGLRRQPVDARSDLFAFCVALHEAVFATHPFPARTVPELVTAIDRGPQPQRDPRVPRHVRDAIVAGLRADPDDRPATMLTLLRALEHDPNRTRLRVAALGIMTSVVVAGVLVLWLARGEAPPPDCRARADAIVTTVWGPERRAALRSGFARLATPLAQDTSGRVERVLDRYASTWQESWTAVCNVREARQQPPSLVAHRLACLERRRDQWESLVATLAHPNELAVVNASTASYALPGVEVCADERWLAAFSSPQADAKIAAAQAAVAKAQVLADLGNTEAGLAALVTPLALARETGNRALESEVRLVEGDLRRAVDPRAAEEPLHAAAIAASSAGRLDVEAAAKVLLVQTLAHSQLRLAETARAAAYAQAAAIRLQDPTVFADYLYARSLAEWSIGGAERSLALELVTLAVNLAIRGPEHPKVAEAYNSLAVSLMELESVEASLGFQRAALAMRERLQGTEHPEALNARGNLAFALAELGQLDEALALQESVATARARVLGPDYFLLAETWIRLSRLYQWELGRSDDALQAARRAQAISEKEFTGEAPEGIASLANLARILAARGETTEADQVSARALAIADATLPPDHALVRNALASRGEALEQAHRCAEAIPILERLDRASRQVVSGRSDLIIGLHALARCERQRRRPEVAETLLLRALAIREQTRGTASPMIADALVELAAFYRERGRTAEAAEIAARAIDRRARTQGVILARARLELAKAR